MASRRIVKPRCLHCGRKQATLPRGDQQPYFCSVRCAAKWALDKAGWDIEWCGKLHDDDPDSDLSGPHGWWNQKDDRSCPECEDESDREAEAHVVDEEASLPKARW